MALGLGKPQYDLAMDISEGRTPTTRPERDIYTVSRLNREVRVLLERGFGSLWLEAEISNFARPSSGHWYFTLKDAAAQVRCCMFRQRNMLSPFTARDGQKVLARARIGLYEPRGEYQLIVDHIEDAGLGALKRQFAISCTCWRGVLSESRYSSIQSPCRVLALPRKSSRH